MLIALKVDVDTYRGTLEGVPALLELFDHFRLRASFLFSLGPDHTGWALRRAFRPGFFGKVKRTSVVGHYGIKTLMYGVLLPGPDIAKRAGHIMQRAAGMGHETGIHCHDHVYWQDNVARRDMAWTRREMDKAMQAYVATFGRAPDTIGAAGWQINPHTILLEQEMGFRYASDCRGDSPFLPVFDGVASRCVQIPTTLPTLDELIGSNGVTEDNVDDAVIAAMRTDVPFHVYTLHAELEGMKLKPVLTRLIRRWMDDGHTLVTLGDVYASLDLQRLPHKAIEWQPLAGRTGVLATEGREMVMNEVRQSVI